MKLLAFSDVHGSLSALSRLKEQSKKADAVLCAGDISTLEHNLPALMAELSGFYAPVLLIHGNHEDEDSLKEAAKAHSNLIFLHKAAHHKDDYVFLGYGGGGFSQAEPGFSRAAGLFFRKQLDGMRRIILVTHAPPYNTKLDKVGGRHVGIKDFRRFIDDVKPHLVICGHLHENAGGSERIGRTLMINPGAAGAMIDI